MKKWVKYYIGVEAGGVMEEWEIKLRQTIDGVTVKPRVDSNWEDRLRRELKQVPSPRKSITKQPLAYFVLFLLVLLNLVIVNEKTNGALVTWARHQYVKWTSPAPEVLKVEKPVPMKPEVDLQPIYKEISELKQKQEEISARQRWDSDRISILGVIVNENFTLLQHVSCTPFIYINRNWKITKPPTTMVLTEEDRKFLERVSKP